LIPYILYVYLFVYLFNITEPHYPSFLDNLVIKVLDKNKRTNLGKIYLDKIKTVIVMMAKAKVTSFTK